MIVGFEGIPGSGKTTVLRHLGMAPHVRRNPASGLLGLSDSWKSDFVFKWFPWARFWENPQQNCEAYLRWRGQAIRDVCALRPNEAGALMMEGSVLPNYMAMAGKECGFMTDFGVVNFVATERMNTFHTDYPDYLVVLRTSPDLAYERLKTRGFPGDEKVTPEYLVACHEALQNFLADLPGDYGDRVFIVENNEEPENFSSVVEEVRALYPQMNDSRQGRADIILTPPEGPIDVLNPRESYYAMVDHILKGNFRMRRSCWECTSSAPLKVPETWTGY